MALERVFGLWSLMRRWTFLLITLMTFLPGSGRGEVADFSPPPANAPFDDIDEATLQAEVTQQALAFLETLRGHWGEGPDRLRTVVGGTVEHEEEGSLIYLRNIHEHGVLEGYEFPKGSLARGRYVLVQRPLNGLNEFIGYYSALKAALSAAYGEPTQDDVIWNNDLYTPLPEYWGVAVMIGHLRYHAAWKTAEGTLALDLSGDRYSRLSIEYRAQGENAQT
ncbi:MAG TPA: hypothetical protein VL261_04175 [Nitrospira sp.]|jgi:hypothetical protein|nr:hypothetical protein [Nitrospira sp.]